MSASLLFMPSGPELIIIVVIILLLFGGRKIPELMRGLGKGIKEFKNASEGLGDVKDEIEKTSKDVQGQAAKSESKANQDAVKKDPKEDGQNS